jgi:hypothetical protein
MVIFAFAGEVFSQTSGNTTIPAPDISLTTRAGDESVAPDDGTTGAVIVASIPEDQQCECGARFEAKLSDSSDWTVLGLIAPMETGDSYEQYQWFYTSNFFEMDKTYDIRVAIYDRLGSQSEYGQNQFSMKPDQENPCSDNTFSNLKKESYGEGNNAVIMLSWDKVCTHQKTANKYVVYRNSEKVGETDRGANNFAVPGAPDGATWKIEASGEEPPNTNSGVIKNCDTTVNGQPYSEIVTKMVAEASALQSIYGKTAVPVAAVDNCQIQGSWLRAVVKFQTYRDDSTLQPPRGWLSGMVTGLGNNGVPYFNFPTGQFPVPGFPNNRYWNGWVGCGVQGQIAPNASGSVTDPWNQLPWICQSDYTFDPNTYHTSYTERFWVNFDLNAQGGGTSVWPVTTTFTY